MKHFLTGEELDRDQLAAVLDRAAELKRGRDEREGAESLAGALGGPDLREALDAHPDLLGGRRRRARGHARGAARGRAAAHPGGVDRRHRPGPLAVLARDRDPLGLPRGGGGAGRRRWGAGDQRADPASPSLPGAGGPAHAAGAVRRRWTGSGSPTSGTATTSRAPWRSSGGRPGSRSRSPALRAIAWRTGWPSWWTTRRRPSKGADAVYTDVWVSMGDEAEAEKRRSDLAPYQLNEELLGRPPTARSRCTACRRIPARRSPRECSTASAPPSGTRPRTACTPRRRCWNGSSRPKISRAAPWCNG